MTYFRCIISTLEGDTLCTDVAIRIEQLPPYTPTSKPWWKGQFNIPSKADFDPLFHHHLALGLEDGRCLNVRLTGLAKDSRTVYFKSSDESLLDGRPSRLWGSAGVAGRPTGGE